MPAPQRKSYTFKEGLTMLAAKAVGVDPYLAAEAGENARAAINAIRNAAKTKQPKDRAGYIREAQNELGSISAAQHPKLVNALQAKLLALQGRGGDAAMAHVEPGEVVIPRAMLTPEVMRMIASEAQRRGIDPRRLMVGGQGSINPATGAEEFSFGGGLKFPDENHQYQSGEQQVADLIISSYPEATWGLGHVGIGVNSDKTVGFYPAQPDDPSALVGAPGVVKPDDQSQPHSIRRIPTTPEQDELVKKYIENRTQNPGEYRLFDENCGDFVRDSMRAGKINVPSYVTINPLDDIVDKFPNQFFKRLK